MLELADLLDGQGAYKHAKNDRLRSVLELMHVVLLGDFPNTVDLVKKLAPELRFYPWRNTVKLFQAVALLTGRFEQSSSGRNLDSMVKTAQKTMAEWLSSQIVNEEDEAQETMAVLMIRNRCKSLIQFLFGYKFDLTDLIESGVRGMRGRFEKVFWVLQTLDNVKHFKKISLGELMRSEKAGEYVRKSLMLIAKLMDDNLVAVKQEQENLESDKKKIVSKQLRFKSYLCRDWKQMEHDEYDFYNKYPDIQYMGCLPESESKVKSWLRKKKRVPGYLGDQERKNPYLTFITALMAGDVHLFLNVMTEFIVNKENMQEYDGQVLRTC